MPPSAILTASKRCRSAPRGRPARNHRVNPQTEYTTPPMLTAAASIDHAFAIESELGQSASNPATAATITVTEMIDRQHAASSLDTDKCSNRLTKLKSNTANRTATASVA